MTFLHLLEEIRTPVGDVFFSMITRLGEETVFLIIGLLFFWCVDKAEGYYMILTGLCGTLLNQFLKIVCRVPRPWVLDDKMTIVESARAGAAGYSFPSGHTQTSVGLYGGIARWNQNKIVRAIGILLGILVAFSRMYLGVHTPYDVGAAAIMAVFLLAVIYPVVQKAKEHPGYLRILFAAITGVAAIYVCYMEYYTFPVDVDTANLGSAMKNAYMLSGAVLGIWLTYEVDHRFLHFETQAVWWAQILKLTGGILLILAVRILLKTPLHAIFEGYLADGIRYFIVVVMAGCVWPMTFPWFRRLGRK